jgi:hypothetical protein
MKVDSGRGKACARQYFFNLCPGNGFLQKGPCASSLLHGGNHIHDAILFSEGYKKQPPFLVNGLTLISNHGNAEAG